MINIADIIEGWRNSLFPPAHLREQIEKVSEERLAICEGCEINSKNAPSHTWVTDLYEHCTECGCPLVAKSKCLSCECGHKKWMAVLTEEEEDSLNIECDGTQEGGEAEKDSPEAIDRNVDGGV